MTRPSDSSIARAFWEEMEEAVEVHYTPTLHEFLSRVKRRAEVLDFDAESPAGTAPVSGPYCKYCGKETHHIGDVCFFCSKAQKAEKVTTSPERVQIPAESKNDAPFSVCSAHRDPSPSCLACGTIVRCPTCRAEMRPGLRCSSPHCGLKETKDAK